MDRVRNPAKCTEIMSKERYCLECSRRLIYTAESGELCVECMASTQAQKSPSARTPGLLSWLRLRSNSEFSECIISYFHSLSADFKIELPSHPFLAK